VSERRPNPVLIPLDGGAMSHADLLAGLKAHEPWAAEAFFEAFAKRVNQLVWRLLGGDPDHDDVVQQVFVSMLTSIHSVRDPAALAGWVTRVAINTVRKEIRSRGYRRRVEPTAVPPDLGSEREGAEERLLVERFYEVAGALNADLRIAFVLHFVEGHTLAEVAAACDYSLATAKRRTSEARRQFQELAHGDAMLASALGEDDHE
jgi:RNA polymerase sigma-70 factor, ECF subfamily